MRYRQNSERINELAKKWKMGTITPEEKAEFDRWYDGIAEPGGTGMNSEPAAIVRDRIFDAIAAREGLGNAAESERRRVGGEGLPIGGEGLRGAAGEGPGNAMGRGSRRSLPRRMRALSAAAILLLLAGTAWFYRPQRPSSRGAVVRHERSQPQPGSSKAVLTLSDGTQVALQPANRHIDDKSGASIQQRDSQLVYHAATAGEDEGPVSYNTITVPRGGQYQLVLSDGTRVWLNSASSLRYPTAFRGNTRLVTLTGEGYFEVAKDYARPFRVEAGGQVIDVLGTEFNVNCYTDETDTRTTLVQGSVRVSLPGRFDSLVIRPGEQAVAANAMERRLRVVDHADIEQVVAWKNGYFQLSDADIRTIMRQAARWYDVDIAYAGKAPEQRLSGKLRRSASVTEFLDMLSYFNIHFQIRGRTITVMAGGGANDNHS